MTIQALKFHGSRQDLVEQILLLGLVGEWQKEPNGVWKFLWRYRGGMHWSETKGTVWFDGPAEAKAALQAIVVPVIVDLGRHRGRSSRPAL